MPLAPPTKPDFSSCAPRQGLIDFAFDPNFNGVSGAFYLSYSVRMRNGDVSERALP